MGTTNTVFPTLLVAFTALALGLTLATGRQTEAGTSGPLASTETRSLQATTVMGNVDCSIFGSPVTAVDAHMLLRYTIALPVTQTEPCDDIGTGGPPVNGDVDCNNVVDLVDSFKILRYVSGLSVTQTEPCPDIGT